MTSGRRARGELRGAGRAGRGGKVIDDDVRPDNRFVLCRSVLISNIQTGRDTFFCFASPFQGQSAARCYTDRDTHHRARLHRFFFSVLFSRFVVGTRCAAATRDPLIRPHRTESHRAAPSRTAALQMRLFLNLTLHYIRVTLTCDAFFIRISISVLLHCEDMRAEQVNI